MKYDHFKMICEIRTNASHDEIEKFAIAVIGRRPNFKYCIIEKMQNDWTYVVSVKNSQGKTTKEFNITLTCLYPNDIASIVSHLSQFESVRLESSIKKHYELFVNEDKIISNNILKAGTLSELIQRETNMLRD